jgi:ParB-like chromosome segregation protein Spo0J
MNNSQDSNKIVIKINSEYSNLVYPLSKSEYEQLKDSIKKDGLILPILINSKDEILDGHNRFRICRELNIPLRYEIKSFDKSCDEKRFVIDVNLKRRHLNDFQKAELAYKLEELEREKARQRQLSQLRNVKDNLSLGPNDHNDKDKGRAIDTISKKTGVSAKTYQRAKTIIEIGPEKIKDKLRQGKTSISKEYDKIQRDKKRRELLSQLDRQDNNRKDTNNNNNCKLAFGDFIKKGKDIPDNSIDLIFTDPPYSTESLLLYQELAKLASRVLKPSGSIVTFVGHIIMDRVITTFNDNSLKNDTGLKYWWIFAVKHSGNHRKIYRRHVFAEWKPMLWYVKGERANNLVISNTIGDHIESTPPSKLSHDWEQSTVEAEHIIKNLTIENQVVLDPMMGAGTTGVASLKLNRKFIGIEKDTHTFEITRLRINNLLS